MRVGLSYHGLLADFEDHRLIPTDTPDGHRYGRPILVRALQAAGHTIVALQPRREPKPFPGVVYRCDDRAAFVASHDDLDVIFLEHRWPTHKNDPTHPQHDPSGHEPDLDVQRQVIDAYRGRCPIISWDTDLQVTPEFEEMYPELVLADPSLRPKRLTRDRISLPFWSDWKELLPTVEPYPIYGYVGNRYGRDPEFERYYFDPSVALRGHGIQASMYGNWLQRSPEREEPRALLARHPTVAFNHRMNFYDSMCMMNRFLCTTHVSKPDYYAQGFVSPRYLEALAVGCPAFKPGGMDVLRGHVFEEHILKPDGVVEAVISVSGWSPEDRRVEMVHQRQELQAMGAFDVQEAVRLIERVGGVR